MTKLEAIIQPTKFEMVKEALIALGVEGMTVSEVRGHGRQKGHTEAYRGNEYKVDLLPKIKVELVLDDKLVNEAVDTIIKTASTGKIGPDLDKLQAEAARAGKPLPAFVRESIVSPNAYVEKGFPKGVMPKNFGTILAKQQLSTLVQFLVASAKKGTK